MIDPPAKKQKTNLDFDEDLAVLSAEEDAELDDFDEFILAQDKTGPSIDQVLAEKVNAGLYRKADKMLGKLIKKFPLPGNIRNLKTPAINTELKKTEQSTKAERFSNREASGTGRESTTAVLNVMHVSKIAIKAKNQIEARTIFEVASDATKLLISAHNEYSQVHREGLKVAYFIFSIP